MKPLIVKVESIDRIALGKLTSTKVKAEIGKATKAGVTELAIAIKKSAELHAKKTISRTKPYNRPHRGAGADKPSYFDAFFYTIAGSRSNWYSEIGNKASDMHIQEGGRNKGARGPNLKNPAHYRIIRDWAKSRHLLKGVFKELKQRRTKKGRFRPKRYMSEKQILFAIVKSIRRRGRPAYNNLKRASLKIVQDSRANNTFSRLLTAALR